MIFSSCVFIFFFYSSAAHRALHSFPTRRSSDLGEPSLGDMTFSQALIQSCDTVYYNLGYGMYQHDNLWANGKQSPNTPVQKMQAMELAWGFGKDTGVDLPEESTGTIPTRKWLYYLWKDN